MSYNEGIRFPRMRERMIKEQIEARGIKTPSVLGAMHDIPRQLFVPSFMHERAYDDTPLPIDEKQTISQPYIVALMTDMLDVCKNDKVLEIGTGSGYQTAVLSRLCRKVYSVERFRSLSLSARERFSLLGLRNIATRIYDGTYGWKEFAPYDRIMVTAAAPFLPEPLAEQLSEGGKMIIPVGGEQSQVLKLYIKQGNELVMQNSVPCQFVKLVGQHGWST